MESFSTRGLPPARKVAYWNALTSDTFAALTIAPRDVRSFDGALLRERMGPITLMEVRSASVRVEHTRQHVARTANPSYLLLAPLTGEFELTLPATPTVRVRAGQFCLIDHAEPYALEHGDDVRTLCVDLPRAGFEQRVHRPALVVGRAMSRDDASSRVLAAVLHELGAELECSTAGRLPDALGRSLLELIATTYAERTARSLPRGARGRARVFREYIDSRLADSEFVPADVAERFRVSQRYVRSVLRSDGESFSSYVLRRRLDRCAARLREADASSLTITAIAFEAGFSNATHFGQAFKARFGVTPSHYRHAAPARSPRAGLSRPFRAPRRAPTHREPPPVED